MTSTFFSFGQNTNLGSFHHNEDIGNPAQKGGATYDSLSQTYALSSGGENIWGKRDEFNFVYDTIQGDFILTANFKFDGKGKNPHRKVGIMLRESTDADAAHVSAVLNGKGLTSLQWRTEKGGLMNDMENEIKATETGYNILQLERTGDTLIMRAAQFGKSLQVIGSYVPEFDSGFLGLFISAHDSSAVENAVAYNVRLNRPVPEDYNAGKRGDLGCRLETINIKTGKRTIIYESKNKFEAPNWMPDGKNLLINMQGSLFRIPISGGAFTQLNTGDKHNLNNDHGISFNGKMIAFSHNRPNLPGYGSTVYVMPISGGEPKMITPVTPSYFHGWAPDNETVAYVAIRKPSTTFNIYKKNIHSGKETALTNTKPDQHVDGCEYSPDGKYIYYNASASGNMQLWRMRPDGSSKEQLTFDKNRNWFPHISPDGKWIAYISFPPSIDLNDHPAYKRVTLNLMPADGGKAEVIAYLYGGQGTINVPSWSPDSKHFAFVSNWGKKSH